MTMPAAPRDLNTPHLFEPPATREQWEARAKELRQQILFSTGLSPMWEKTPLNPRVTGKIDAPDFTVENVALETYPGFYLCGNLYRPKGKKGPFPAIANPHGHWENGRLEMQADVPKADPPPAKPGEGKGNLVAIGVNLARQGFVVFAYDMPGYNDTSQVRHRQFAADLESWLWGISILGLQLWNSIRVVDYLESLPDVDKKRIGVTGASGGGTQTFLLAAVDERIKASVPVNMVSAHMQGGCLCENAPGLRVGTDNVEIAAAFAPRPQLLVAATGDWTKDNPTKEWPTLKRVYDLCGAGEKTQVRQFNYGHNYNVESREAMYAFFNRWLNNKPDADVTEKPFTLDAAAMRVWNDKTPRPPDAKDEAALIAALKKDAENRLAALRPGDVLGGMEFRKRMGPALRQSLFVRVPESAESVAGHRERGKFVLIAALESDKAAVDALRKALNEKGCVAAPLLLRPTETTADTLWKEFFTTYNRTPLGDRVQEIIDMLVKTKRQSGYDRVEVAGVGQAGLWTLLARGVMSDVVPGVTVVDTDGFDNTNDRAFVERLYAPGLRRAGDVTTAALLAAPNPLCLHNTGAALKTDAIAAVYKAMRIPLRVEQGPLSAEEIAEWLARS